VSAGDLIRRSCTVVVSTGGGKAIEIKTDGAVEGLAVKFTIKRSLKPEPNTCDLTLYNLNRDHRLALQSQKSALVQVDAGYVGATSTLFLGDLRTTFSQREGADWVTQLSSGDGEKAIQTSRANIPIRKGSDIGDVLTALAKALGVGAGNVSSAVAKLRATGVAGAFSMGTVLSGSAASELSRILEPVGYTWSVQAGVLQIVGITEALTDFAINLSESSGMIGSPSVDKDGVLSVRMLIQPHVLPGRKLVLKAHEIAGQYKIEETTHTGEPRGNDWYIDAKARPY
jgi:hypothetical protein